MMGKIYRDGENVETQGMWRGEERVRVAKEFDVHFTLVSLHLLRKVPFYIAVD